MTAVARNGIIAAFQRNGRGVTTRGPAGIALALALGAGLPAAARADATAFRLFPEDAARFPPAEARELSLGAASFPAVSPDGGAAGTGASAAELAVSGLARADDAPPAPAGTPRRPLLSGKTLGLTLGVIAAVPVVGELVWWRGNEKGKFHFHDEGWFGRDTYAGGADKASHFFYGYMASRELSRWYQRFGNPAPASRALAVAVAALGGALIELGDGFTEVYGYAWGDVASNVAGALAAAGIEAGGIDDLVGFRYGFVSADIPPPCCRAFGFGHDYSEDVYSADLKLAGVLRRAGVRPGIGRFFLVSLTYGTKGYRFSPVDVRERNLGIDLGLNVPEILLAVGVPPSRWWGDVLLTLARYVRIPYTAFGYQYDLNHRRWHGPSTGDRFDPGRVIYP